MFTRDQLKVIYEALGDKAGAIDRLSKSRSLTGPQFAAMRQEYRDQRDAVRLLAVQVDDMRRVDPHPVVFLSDVRDILRRNRYSGGDVVQDLCYLLEANGMES